VPTRVVSLLTALVVSCTGLWASAELAPAAAGQVVHRRLHAAIERLPVAAEHRAGYVWSALRLWVDADHDCQYTRAEVLAAESTVRVHGCSIHRGRWRSAYDGVVTRDPGRFDIDHLVPLAEAWDSGARSWTAATRQRYANDLGDPRTLVAVSASANRSKGDRDPAGWLPRLDRCGYVRRWVAVKIRWSLTVDRTEKRALRAAASGCTDPTIRVGRAHVVRSGSGSGSGSGSASVSGSRLDPRFDYCYQTNAAGYGPYVRGRDPEYSWYTDADHDGVVCES
jgi:hypothetical protein